MLRERLDSPPDDGGLWTGPKVARWMASRLGLEHVHAPRGWEALKKLEWSLQEPRPKNPHSASPEEAAAFKKNLSDTLAEEAAAHPHTAIEVWATDEHRLGLKPVHRRVWAPIGERPIALGHHRYQWLYVTAFVEPTGGESVWYLSNAVGKPFFERLLADFARTVGAGTRRIVVLVLDGAGWHTRPGLTVPDGLRLVYLPPYTPELQPAEHLWALVDEPVANRWFETLDDLDAVLDRRCCELGLDRPLIAAHTAFKWWPKPVTRN